MHTQESELYCEKCDHVWKEETLCNVAVSVWTAHIKSLRCPKCRAGWKQVSFVTDRGKLDAKLAAKGKETA